MTLEQRQLVAKLHEMTGLGILKCVHLLEQNDWDLEAAIREAFNERRDIW